MVARACEHSDDPLGERRRCCTVGNAADPATSPVVSLQAVGVVYAGRVGITVSVVGVARGAAATPCTPDGLASTLAARALRGRPEKR